ncbi:hypothetical protein Pan44_20820 [Caulifigura coniformis]|uniref:Uncharacterized protein n=1 Tax=Caulifigura coniformis TaxID=2527983 RepID=A0A517SD76_9PLAN|nr:hypothetical protein [Caulifigura coniformis]QDT54055.1 hypothetical protein Pan44_20820 [Caulifigura coniformis]
MCRVQFSVRAFLAICILVPALAGCGKPKVDSRAEFDHDVETVWSRNWNLVDAEKFLGSGGLFVDSGEPEAQALDRPHILPLLKLLREKHGLKWQAAVHKKKTGFAVALVARIPAGSEVETITRTLDQEQGAFPGEILWKFGHRWMSIDFLDQEYLEWEREAERKSQAT